MSKDNFLNAFKVAQRDQMNARTMEEFIPVNEIDLAQSDIAFSAPYRSFGFQSAIPEFRRRAAPIIYLHGSAKAMFLLSCENMQPMGASKTFNTASEIILDIIDAAIADLSTDLLVLIADGGNDVFQLNAAQTVDEIVSRAVKYEHADWCHSLVRLQGRLLRLHCEGLSKAGFLAFRRAMSSIETIGLFDGEGVAPLALDFFPSLANRESELVLRRAELRWRPETSDDPVVVVGGLKDDP